MKVKYTQKVNSIETVLEIEFEVLNEESVDLMGLLKFPIREQPIYLKQNMTEEEKNILHKIYANLFGR